MSADKPAARAASVLRVADPGGGTDAFLARLRDADEPLALVRELTPFDLLAVLRAADDEQSGEILALADREQTRHVVDLSCWDGDRLNLVAISELLAPLIGAGLDGAGKALDDLGEELRTLILKPHVTIHLRENKDDDVPVAEGSELIACRDGYYFVELPRPDDVPELVRQLLAALLERPFEDYQPELECLRHDLPTELEHLALRWRNGRLADLGFGTREEALVLLDPLDPGPVREAIDRGAPPPHPLHGDGRGLPAIYGDNLGGDALLDRAIAALLAATDPDLASRAGLLGAELGAMTSLFLTALGSDLADPAAVARDVRRARSTLALGLSAVAGVDPQVGARALATQVPGVLIRCAMGLLAPLRERARALLVDPRLALRGERGALIDPPLAIAVRALARDLPSRWPPLEAEAAVDPDPVEPSTAELEAFSEPLQLEHAAALLAEAEQLPVLLFDRLGFDAVPQTEGVRATSLVLAALVNASIDAEPARLPLDQAATEEFARSFLEREERAAGGEALASLAPLVGVAAEGTVDPSAEPDPLRRLLLRLIVVGRARLESREPLVFLPLVT